MIPGIVLAAGQSSRFGGRKALAPAWGEPFISRIVRILREGGVDSVAVVQRPGDDELEAVVGTQVPFARTVVNGQPDRGQLSSLLLGLDAVDGPEVDAVLVTLVDVPLVTADTVGELLARARVSTAAIIRPAYGTRHGHPVIFRRTAFAALRGADPTIGAKAVVRTLSVEDVPVTDAGVIEDVDTPGDYSRLFGDSTR